MALSIRYDHVTGVLASPGAPTGASVIPLALAAASGTATVERGFGLWLLFLTASSAYALRKLTTCCTQAESISEIPSHDTLGLATAFLPCSIRFYAAGALYTSNINVCVFARGIWSHWCSNRCHSHHILALERFSKAHYRKRKVWSTQRPQMDCVVLVGVLCYQRRLVFRGVDQRNLPDSGDFRGLLGMLAGNIHERYS